MQGSLFLLALFLSSYAFAEGPQSTPSILCACLDSRIEIHHLSFFVLEITGAIFVVVAGLLIYVIIRFRAGNADDDREPAQIYGSNQVELAWTVIPVLIVVVLFPHDGAGDLRHPGRPDAATQRWKSPSSATSSGGSIAIRNRASSISFTANELHVPLSNSTHPTPTYLKLLSADADHSFWVPQLAGKIDLIPNHPNDMWIDPLHTGLYVGQCAQFCGVQHANMLLRVYVDTPEQFAAWAK